MIDTYLYDHHHIISCRHPVPRRKTSVKIRAIGLFPGSKVTRGRDWEWDDQDGGQGSEGEVMDYANVSPDSCRDLVRVQWAHGFANSYRFGFHGFVDLACVEEEVGPFYYRDHLPLLGKHWVNIYHLAHIACIYSDC